jgi:hypothetical protein
MWSVSVPSIQIGRPPAIKRPQLNAALEHPLRVTGYP